MTTTDLQHSILEARSREAADKLYVARDSVLAFLSAPLTVKSCLICYGNHPMWQCEEPERSAR